MKKTIISVAFIAILHAKAAFCGVLILDQSQERRNGGLNATGNTIAQSFTVGISGQLSAIEFQLSSPGGGPTDLIFAVVAPLLDGSPPIDWQTLAIILETRTIPDQSRRFERFDFTPFDVSAGDQLFWIVQDSNSGGFSPSIAIYGPSFFDEFLGGELWTADNSGAFFLFRDDGADLIFRTFVHVPEPTTLAILGLGLLGFGFARKYKRAA